MKRKSNSNLLQVKGIGVSRFINLCSSNNIEISNVIKVDAKTLEFNITDNNYSRLRRLNLNDYAIEVKKVGGKKLLVNCLIYRIGLIIGIIISLIGTFFINNRLLNIEISGLGKYSKEEIIKSINDYGLNFFSKMDIDFIELENYLTNSFDFSLVSIISKGNSLIINIKEELSDISDKYVPITADYNMIITEINVFAGTPNVSIGDIVYLGDVLVYPYEIINGENKPLLPMAEIKGDTFYSVNYNFKSTEDVYERTGNKKIIKMNYSLGKFNLISDIKNNDYATFELEEVNYYISNYFLPIKVNKVIAHETTLVTKDHNFEEEKDGIIEKLRKELYEKIPDSLKIEDEEIKISSTKYGNIVTIYAKSSVYLNYK